MDEQKITILQAVLAVVSIIAMAWGTRFNWPDFIHVKHGFPLTWGVHTLVTIVGPVDTWSVNLVFLVLDLTVWFILLLTLPFLLRRYST